MKKVISFLLSFVIVINSILLLSVSSFAQSVNETNTLVSLEGMPIVDHGSYKGNQGDSTVYNLNGKGLSRCDKGQTFNAYGNVGIDGTAYYNGFEVWIARWNFTPEVSWAYATFDIGGSYKKLTGKTNLIKSYNTKRFDTTIYFYDGETLLASYNLTNSDYIKEINVDVSGVKQLKLLVKDNVAVSGGTSFALYDMFLDGEGKISSDPKKEYCGHYYQFFDISLTWEEAKQYCESLGGYLATVTSHEEQAFLTNMIETSSKEYLWLGAKLDRNEKFSWITGEEFDYTNWDPGEPNNIYGIEYYLMMYTRNSSYDAGTWNDARNLSGNELGFICEWGENYISTSKQEKYLQQHVDFVNSATFNTVSNDFRYAKTLWTNYHGSTSKAIAEFVYDVQEGFFETISFQGMSSLENPYDAIILDLLSSKNVNASLSDVVDSSVISVIDSVIGDLITTFQADSDWENDTDIAGNFKDLLDLEATDYSSNKLYQSLDNLFNGKSTDQINSIFSKYDCYSNVLVNISDAAKGVDYFLEILKYTASIEAYYNASEEFKVILKEVADVIPSVNVDYGQKFNETYNNYSSCLDYDSIMQNVLNHATEEGFWLLTDLMSDVLQDSALSFCKTALKMSESAAGTLVASLWAAETGFNLGNLITENDTLINCRRLLRANYMLDEAVHNVMSSHASTLKANPSYEEALYFDAAFNLFKNLQLNSLELHQKYMKANGSSFINFLLGKQDFFTREAEVQAIIIDTWKNINCHDNLMDSVTYSKSNTVVVACPTNVYVYRESDGELVASVVNNQVYNIDSELTVIAESNEKAICLPDLDDYKIKIEATDVGSMTVDYTVNSLKKSQRDRVVLFNDIKLDSESSFDFQVDSDSNDVFLIDKNQNTILPDLDSLDLEGEIKDGYYYVNGVPTDLGLFKHISGNYYVSQWDGKILTGKYYVWKVHASASDISVGWYWFEDDGKMFQGILPNPENDDALYYFINGKSTEIGLFKYTDGNYYVAGANGKIVTSENYKTNNVPGKYYVWKVDASASDIEIGWKYVDENGRLLQGILDHPEKEGKYYFVNGQAKDVGLFQHTDGKYYATQAGGKLVTSDNYTTYAPGKYKVQKIHESASGFKTGWYYFDADGVTLQGICEHPEKGGKYYFENGQAKEMGLFRYRGKYYVSQYDGKIITSQNHKTGKVAGKYYVWNIHESAANACSVGWYVADENGIMSPAKNGIVDGYYYIEGAPTEKGLFKHTDGYYYIAQYDGKIITSENHQSGNVPGKYYVWKTSGCDHLKGWRYVGADGRLLQGICEHPEKGGLYYFVNGVVKEVGLFKYTDGNYYVAQAGGLIVTSENYTNYAPGKYYVWNIHESASEIKAGWYYFGQDGAMLQGIHMHPEKNDLYFFENGKVKDIGFFKYSDGNYYCTQAGGKLVTSENYTQYGAGKYYVWKIHESANDMKAGWYFFDETGKMITE